MSGASSSSVCFFFNDTATTEIYTLSLHDALPICREARVFDRLANGVGFDRLPERQDRKSTRLNSSHDQISYAVFCLKKKKWCLKARPHSLRLSVGFRPGDRPLVV